MAPGGGRPDHAAMDRARRWVLVALALGLALSITLAELAVGALALLVLASGRAGRPPLLVPIVVFVAWTAVSALASPRPLDSLVEGRGVLWLAVVWVVAAALDDAREAHRFATGLFVAVSAVALLAIVQVAACPATPPEVPGLARFFRKCSRARGFFSIYMTLAGVLTLVLVGALPRLAGTGRQLAWAGPAWAVGLVALGLTHVRGAWIGFVLGVAGSLAVLRRARLVLAVTVAVVVVVLAVPGVRHRLGRITLDNETTRDRLAMLDGGLDMIRDHPLLGVGPGQVKHTYPTYAPPEALRRSTSHLHNTPLQVTVERGVIGLGLWLWIFAAWFRRAGRAWRALSGTADRALALGALLAIVAFLAAGLFEYNFGDTEVLLAAGAVMALPFVLARAQGVSLERAR
jgi:O-antigen ligase